MKLIYSLLSLVLSSVSLSQEPDGKIGTYQQDKASQDCFFLASLTAASRDPEGSKIINALVRKTKDPSQWNVRFPSYPEDSALVSVAELSTHRLSDKEKRRVAPLSKGDDDVKILQIAADKIWLKHKVKPEGLWDDVPMNAFYMFSDDCQQLIWNREKASKIAINDVDKYKRLPAGTVKEIQVQTVDSAHDALAKILEKDADGISMVLLDYQNYHAFVIAEIDFESRSFSVIDPLQGSEKVRKVDLRILLEGISSGIYGINYIEIE